MMETFVLKFKGSEARSRKGKGRFEYSSERVAEIARPILNRRDSRRDTPVEYEIYGVQEWGL